MWHTIPSWFTYVSVAASSSNIITLPLLPLLLHYLCIKLKDCSGSLRLHFLRRLFVYQTFFWFYKKNAGPNQRHFIQYCWFVVILKTKVAFSDMIKHLIQIVCLSVHRSFGCSVPSSVTSHHWWWADPLFEVFQSNYWPALASVLVWIGT